MASLLYCFPYRFRSLIYWDSHSCSFLSLLEAIAKSKETIRARGSTTIAIARAKEDTIKKRGKELI